MDLLQALNEYRVILGAFVVLFATAVLVIRFWDRVSLFWLNVVCATPLIGRVTRLARDTTSGTGKWFLSELSICADFSKHYEAFNKDSDFFEKCQIYLDKVHEKGRNHLPLAGWLLIKGVAQARRRFRPMRERTESYIASTRIHHRRRWNASISSFQNASPSSPRLDGSSIRRATI